MTFKRIYPLPSSTTCTHIPLFSFPLVFVPTKDTTWGFGNAFSTPPGVPTSQGDAWGQSSAFDAAAGAATTNRGTDAWGSDAFGAKTSTTGELEPSACTTMNLIKLRTVAKLLCISQSDVVRCQMGSACIYTIKFNFFL